MFNSLALLICLNHSPCPCDVNTIWDIWISYVGDGQAVFQKKMSSVDSVLRYPTPEAVVILDV